MTRSNRLPFNQERNCSFSDSSCHSGDSRFFATDPTRGSQLSIRANGATFFGLQPVPSHRPSQNPLRFFAALVVTTDVANGSSLRCSGPTRRRDMGRCDRSSLATRQIVRPAFHAERNQGNSPHSRQAPLSKTGHRSQRECNRVRNCWPRRFGNSKSSQFHVFMIAPILTHFAPKPRRKVGSNFGFLLAVLE